MFFNPVFSVYLRRRPVARQFGWTHQPRNPSRCRHLAALCERSGCLLVVQTVKSSVYWMGAAFLPAARRNVLISPRQALSQSVSRPQSLLQTLPMTASRRVKFARRRLGPLVSLTCCIIFSPSFSVRPVNVVLWQRRYRAHALASARGTRPRVKGRTPLASEYKNMPLCKNGGVSLRLARVSSRFSVAS